MLNLLNLLLLGPAAGVRNVVTLSSLLNKIVIDTNYGGHCAPLPYETFEQYHQLLYTKFLHIFKVNLFALNLDNNKTLIFHLNIKQL